MANTSWLEHQRILIKVTLCFYILITFSHKKFVTLLVNMKGISWFEIHRRLFRMFFFIDVFSLDNADSYGAWKNILSLASIGGGVNLLLFNVAHLLKRQLLSRRVIYLRRRLLSLNHMSLFPEVRGNKLVSYITVIFHLFYNYYKF